MKLFPVYEYLQHEHERALESKERDASLRLASDRQNLNVAWERYASMGEKIKLATGGTRPAAITDG